MRTATSVYRRFVEFEEKAAAVYLRLASHFSPRDPQLGAFWLGMAIEEKQHAGLLQFCLAERMFTEDLPTEAEIRKFNRLFRNLEKRAGDPNINVNRAFELASALEGSEVDAIYRHLTTPLNVSPYLLKRKIVTSPSSHLDELAAAGRKFGANAKSLKKLDQLRNSLQLHSAST